MDRHFVFHFYAGRDWRDNIANQCHFNCIKKYHEIFSDATIVIAKGEGISEQDVCEVRKSFVEVMGDTTVTFKTVTNSPYYEALTFKTEIIDNAEKIDGLTFFGHNKGVSNVLNKEISKDAVLTWICGMYFYCLGFIDEVEHRLCTEPNYTFYGAYLMEEPYIKNAGHCWYAGTFYWVNTGRLLALTKKIPEMFDRQYAEWLPGEIFGTEWKAFLGSHGNVILPDSDLYRNPLFCPKNAALYAKEFKSCLDSRNDILQDTKIYKYTVLTYNFGGYEIMREIGKKSENAEYIYVTDDESLKSETWNVVIDHDLDGLSPIEKVQKVRENPFKYCSTALCIRIDASIEINGSLDRLVEDFYLSNKDIGVMVHPERSTITDEYKAWESFRGISSEEGGRVIAALNGFGYDTTVNGLYETGFMILPNSPYVKSLLGEYAAVMSELGRVRVDQVVFSAVLNKLGLYIFPMSHACIQSSALCSMEHNSCYTCVVHNIPEYGYVNNEIKKLYSIDE